MTKKYDLAVKVSEYTNNNGETKANWKNIGAVMQGEKGFYMILDRSFNPAGVRNPENRDSLLVSMFEPRDNNQSGQAQQSQQEAPNIDDPFSDPIPF